MIQLTDTKYGSKRKAIIGSVSFDVLSGNMEISFYVQILDGAGILLNDLSVNQNRRVSYSVSNQNKVNAQFNPVQTGGTGEYDFFMSLIDTVFLKTAVLQLGAKLNSRGIFD